MNEISGSPIGNGTIEPSSSTNRGALSEAWYRALYPPRPAQAASGASGAARAATDGSHASAAGSRRDPAPRGTGRPGPATASAPARRAPAVVAIRRGGAERTARAARPAQPWRAALARRFVVRCSVRGVGGVDVLVQQRGRRLSIVALADSAPAALAAAAAVHRVRGVLAAHGLRLDSDIAQRGSA